MANEISLSYRRYQVDADAPYTPIEGGRDVHGRPVLRVSVRGSDNKEYQLMLSQQTIAVLDHKTGKPVSDEKSKEILLGETIITEETRTSIFNYFLAHKRQQTSGDGGIRAAAIVVSDDGHAFVGVNTVTQNTYFKDCAETNAVNAMVMRSDIYPQTEEYGITRAPPDIPKIADVYVMAGREAKTRDPKDQGLHVSCPCGKCTDMLDKMMVEDGTVHSLPIPNQKALGTPRLRTATEAPSISNVDGSKGE